MNELEAFRPTAVSGVYRDESRCGQAGHVSGLGVSRQVGWLAELRSWTSRE